MNKILIHTLVVWLVLVLFCQCQPDISDLELPNEGKRLVLFGILSPDSIVQVSVTSLARPLNPTDSKPVPNCRVVVLENDKPIDTLQYDAVAATYYSAKGLRPGVGQSYAVIAQAPDYPEARSLPETIFPLPSFDRVILRDSVIDDIRIATIELKTDASVGRFLTEKVQVPNPNPKFAPLVLFTLADDFQCPPDTDGYLSRNLNVFDLKCLSTPVKRLLFTANYISVSELKKNTVTARIGYASEAFYRYLESYALQQSNQSSPLFTQPSPVRSNIIGGYGLVAAHSMRTFSFKF